MSELLREKDSHERVHARSCALDIYWCYNYYSAMRTRPGVQFDVAALLSAKNPALARRLPRLAFVLLRRIAHQYSVQRALRRLSACEGCAFSEAALNLLGITVTVTGEEHLPDAPHILMVANHPTGGIDGLILLSLLCRRYGTVRVPANDLLMALAPLRELLVPVDKHGSNATRRVAYRQMYDAPHPLLLFPAGRTARPAGGVLREFPWSTSFVAHAQRSGRLIVPVHLSGANSWRFYGLWRLRRALGITPNLEMFLLVDELVRQRGTHRVATIAPPVDPTRAAGRDAQLRCIRAIRHTVAAR